VALANGTEEHSYGWIWNQTKKYCSLQGAKKAKGGRKRGRDMGRNMVRADWEAPFLSEREEDIPKGQDREITINTN